MAELSAVSPKADVLPEWIRQLKRDHMDRLAEHRRKLYRQPELRHLFLELTLQCNEHCFHCGSRCGHTGASGLKKEQYLSVLHDVREHFDIRKILLCITGGEPLLYPDFFPLLEEASAMGFRWGMTSNATLIDKKTAAALRKAGMKTISVSIDGLEETHDRLRGLKGGYRRAMAGIQNLIDEGGFEAIQVTTVINHENIDELDALYGIMEKLDIDSWRVIGLEPIGRALEYPERMLTPEDHRRLFRFIREKRLERMPVQYGCSHYLGVDLEREVRKWYFLCNAGIHTASITADGDVTACLDIEKRPETVQGSIFEKPFSEIWKERFEIFRSPLAEKSTECSGCEYKNHCAGGAAHSWDFDRNEQRICFKGILF